MDKNRSVSVPDGDSETPVRLAPLPRRRGQAMQPSSAAKSAGAARGRRRRGRSRRRSRSRRNRTESSPGKTLCGAVVGHGYVRVGEGPFGGIRSMAARPLFLAPKWVPRGPVSTGRRLSLARILGNRHWKGWFRRLERRRRRHCRRPRCRNSCRCRHRSQSQ